MANKKISDYTAATSVAAGDLIEIETAGGDSRKVTKANFGGGRAVNLGTMRPASDFTAINCTGNRSATDTSGKAITVKESSPDTTVRVVGLTRNLPSTTCRVAVFVQANMSPRCFQAVSFGFSDGTKYDTYQMVNLAATNAAGNVEHDTWSNSTTRVGATPLSDTIPTSYNATGFWIGLRVDNTAGKAYWETSSDGVNFATLVAVTQSSGYLGTGGYTKAFVGLFAYNTDVGGTDYPCSVSILDWDESGLSRSFG